MLHEVRLDKLQVGSVCLRSIGQVLAKLRQCAVEIGCLRMKIVTWNVNSIKMRQKRAVAWLQQHQPDVLCLQELKSVDENIPVQVFEELGYQVLTYGQKAYNGVAILSRHPMTLVSKGMQDDVDDPQARLIAADIQGVRIVCVYVPNGMSVDSDKYAYKKAWLARLHRFLQTQIDFEKPAVVCGDFNIAPRANDIRHPERWENSVLFHPEMRQTLQTFLEQGWVDVFAEHHPEGGLYSWWNYRELSFVKNNGLRIDLILTTKTLGGACQATYVDRDERKGEKPSDHAPVVAEFTGF